MAGGRPLKFQSVEELQNVADQEVCLNPKGVRSNDFSKENELCDFIEGNLLFFCETILQDNLISFEREYQFGQHYFGPREPRVDFLIIGEKSHYLVEVKNPQNLAENRAAIGQLLNYGRKYLDPKKTLVLITSKFDHETACTIQEYKLPIRYIYLDKKRSLEFLKNNIHD